MHIVSVYEGDILLIAYVCMNDIVLIHYVSLYVCLCLCLSVYFFLLTTVM